MADISVIGLGRLGLPLAAVLASRGFEVIGVDVDPRARRIANCQLFVSIEEPGLQELLSTAADNLVAISSLQRAVRDTEITIVLVNTPSETDSSFALGDVLRVCENIGGTLWGKDDYHVIVISSTVMPGSCGGPIREMLEAESGKQMGRDFGLCYCPEFGALGKLVAGFLKPDFVLVGSSDPRADSIITGMYEQLCTNNPPIAHVNLIDAELAKIAVNCYATMKMTFANQLAELCELIPGASIGPITDAIGLDSRIGRKFLTGATAYGGPCFPRDIRALERVSSNVGLRLPLIAGIHEMNRWQIDRLAVRVKKLLRPKGTAGILGLAYKPGMDVIAESAGHALASVLRISADVVAYDPLVAIGESVRTAQACVDRADVIVITTLDNAFRNLAFREGQTVVDCWRMLDRETVVQQGAKYVAIGVGPCE